MRYIIIMLLVVCGIIVGLFNPTIAAVFHVWTVLFRPVNFVYRPESIMLYLSVISSIVLFGSIIIAKIRGKISFKWNVGASYLLLILATASISAFFSYYQDVAFENLMTIIKIIAPFLAIGIIITSRERFLWVVSACVVCIGLWAIQGAVHGLIHGAPQIEMKIGGQMSDRNDFALGILMTFPICYYLAKNLTLPLIRWGLFFSSGLMAISIIISNSRAAILGLFIISALILSGTKTRLWKYILIFMLIIVSFFFFAPEYAVERLETINWIGDQTEISAFTRLHLMRSGFEAAIDNPFWGLGPGIWQYYADEYIPEEIKGTAWEPHSIWVKIADELGFIGLGIYIVMFGTLFVKLRKIMEYALKEKKLELYYDAKMLVLSLLAYCIVGSFLNQIYFEYMFLLVSVSGAYIAINENEISGTSTIAR